MSIGQNINSASEAPANLLDMKGGGTPDAPNPLQSQAVNEMSSPTGSFLSGMDRTVDEALEQGDRAEAALAGDKPMEVSSPSQALPKQSNLVSVEGGKQYLNIPPTNDIYTSAGATEAFNRLFDSKKPSTAA